MKVFLECKDGRSSKFWEVKVSGSSVTVRFGRIGTSGQIKRKDYSSPAEAKKDVQKQITAKQKKGYVEATSGEVKKTAKKKAAPTSDGSRRSTQKPKVDTSMNKASQADDVEISLARDLDAEFNLIKRFHLQKKDKDEVAIIRGDYSADRIPFDFRDLDSWLGFKRRRQALAGLIVDGDLTVNGPILNWELDFGPFLLITGNLHAENMGCGGSHGDEVQLQGPRRGEDAQARVRRGAFALDQQ